MMMFQEQRKIRSEMMTGKIRKVWAECFEVHVDCSVFTFWHANSKLPFVNCLFSYIRRPLIGLFLRVDIAFNLHCKLISSVMIPYRTF